LEFWTENLHFFKGNIQHKNISWVNNPIAYNCFKQKKVSRLASFSVSDFADFGSEYLGEYDAICEMFYSPLIGFKDKEKPRVENSSACHLIIDISCVD
jgi:hypothetical protein